MTEKFLDILKQCNDKTDTWGFKDGCLYFEVRGFSKSGNVKLYEKDGKIYCLARYDELDEIEDYDDLVRIAFRWFFNYKDRGYEPASEWVHDFIRLNLIKKKVEEKITYQII